MKKTSILLFILLVMSIGLFAQTTIHSNACTSATAGWTFTNGGGVVIQQSGYWLVDNAGDQIISEAFDVTSYTSLTLTFKVGTYGSGTNHSCLVEYSSDNGANWSATTFTSATPTSSTLISAGTWNLGTISTTQLMFRWTTPSGGSKGVRIDDILFQGTASTPTINVSVSSLSGFTYVYENGPSTPEKTFTISGSNLTNNISVAATTNYEISKSSGTGYDTPLVYTPAEAATPQTIYVRLKAGLSIGTYNSEDITASSTGASNKTVTCSGTVTTPPPPNAPVATAASDLASDGFVANWNSVSGANSYELDVYTQTAGVLATDLFISEYVEGLSNNKYIEIFNGTGISVDLSNYRLQLYANGATSTTSNVTLSGTLDNGACIVYKNSSAALTLPDGVTAYSNAAVNYNGDDAVALYKISADAYVDIFGRIGEDPGTEWGTSPLSTLDRTLVRKSSVSGGVTTNPGSGFPTLTTEWDSYATDTATYLGSHTMAGGASVIYVSGYEDLNVSNVTEYEVTDLDPSTDYYYVVRAVGTYGTSVNSNTITATTYQANYIPPSNPSGTLVETGVTVIITDSELGGGLVFDNGWVPDSGTPVTNNTFVVVSSFSLTGTGTITFTIESEYPYAAYWQNGVWHSVPNIDGVFTFEIDFDAKPEIPIILGEGGDPTLPVELSSFTATITAQNYVVLQWTTQSESNLAGYFVYRNTSNNLDTATMIPAQIAATNTSVETNYSFVDQEVETSGTYYYWLESIELNSHSDFHGPISVILTENNNIIPPVIPVVTELRNIYPNPFNPQTIISYNVAKSAKVTIDIYNVKGAKVRSLIRENKNPGSYQIPWNGNDDNGKPCTTGIYYIKMTAGKYVTTKKAVLTK